MKILQSNPGLIVWLQLPSDEATKPFFCCVFVAKDSKFYKFFDIEDAEKEIANTVKKIFGKRRLEFSEFKKFVRIDIGYTPAYRDLRNRLYWWLYKEYKNLFE